MLEVEAGPKSWHCEVGTSELFTVADRPRVLVLSDLVDCDDELVDVWDAEALFFSMTAAPSEFTRTRIPLFEFACLVEGESCCSVAGCAECAGEAAIPMLRIGRPELLARCSAVWLVVSAMTMRRNFGPVSSYKTRPRGFDHAIRRVGDPSRPNTDSSESKAEENRAWKRERQSAGWVRRDADQGESTIRPRYARHEDRTARANRKRFCVGA
ncbi:hypothetical protein PHSY_003338 [Pseudozyma hubeiensis SY62]|uniref:Uncharacterized protein n=1 Tax=Pseudozyma hubeiensis (strain SY62) TaxID=1305764 RepID=R9P3D2_PSEHS|nr:hypothetical protein PHSY_003338 [Pseudozyma hubeiensis SY62]GAC95762.1 hypothetical protein PHSY_003338 [Pseudozyma hubeiensis SY62]